MSRCFPFPPPGYERKARTEEVDLLKKEKHKEKKHKKEKKDNEKRERNGKRGKDRSNEKHQEKTEKKEKCRDRDKKRDKDKAKDKSNALTEKRISGKTGEVIHKDRKDINNRNAKKSPFIVDKSSLWPFSGYKTNKISQSNHHEEHDKDFKLVQELGRRIKIDARRAGSPIETFTCLDRKMDEGMVKQVARDTGGMNEVTEKKYNKVQDKAEDWRGIKDETSTRGNTMAQVGVVQTSEGTSSTVDKKAFRNVEGKEKKADDKAEDKWKEKDTEKKSHGKDKDREKYEEKEKTKEIIQVRYIAPDKVGENNKNHILCANAIKTEELPKDSNRSGRIEGNHKKRKDFEINGVFHANDLRPTKLSRPVPSLAMENGRVLKSCQNSIFHASGKQGAANNSKVELKSPNTQVDLARSSRRPSHPDSMYLSQIYSVPNIQELLKLDAQEWLFSSNDSEHMKPGIEASSFQDTPQVWAEALQIGSADVCALPYVIPY